MSNKLALRYRIVGIPVPELSVFKMAAKTGKRSYYSCFLTDLRLMITTLIYLNM